MFGFQRSSFLLLSWHLIIIHAYIIFKAPSTLQITVGIGHQIRVDNHSFAINLGVQAQYRLPTNATEIVSSYPEVEGRNYRQRRQACNQTWTLLKPTPLLTRSQFLRDAHQAAELWLDDRGLPGRKCLQAAICANSAIPFSPHVGLFESILHIFLRPSLDPNSEEDLLEAELQGTQGIDVCLEKFPLCSDLYRWWTLNTAPVNDSLIWSN